MSVTRRTALRTALVAVPALGAQALGACSTSTNPVAASARPTATRVPSAFPTPSSAPSPRPTGLTADTVQAVISRFSTTQPSAWGMDIDGIVQRSGGDALALTLDACGGPHGSGVDMKLLEFLQDRQIRATLFLNQRWIEANPDLAHELAKQPLFELGNHGTRHCPLCVTGRDAYGIPGTANASEAAHEVADNHETLTELTGREPRLFRSGTAHYDDVGVEICRALGEVPLGFEVNADGGATFTVDQILTAISSVNPGSVIIAHMNQPRADTGAGLMAAIPRLLDQGFTFSHVVL